METILTSLVSQLPNLAVAVWCIYNYQQTIKGLLDQQNKLLDQLLTAKGFKSEIDPANLPGKSDLQL